MSIKQFMRDFRNRPGVNNVVVPLARAVLQAVGIKPVAVVRRFVRIGDVRQPLPNGRIMTLWSAGDDEVPTLVYWFGWDGYETETARVYYRLAESALVVLDIGAHAGYFSVVAALANQDAKVFAFDPLPVNRDRIAMQLERNGIGNVVFVLAALSDFNGEADFFEPRVADGGLPCGGSLAEGHFQQDDDLVHHSVSVMTGDTFVANQGLSRVDLIKMDTESTEPAVLRGLGAVIAANRPNIICEVLCRPEVEAELDLIVAGYGYKAYHLRPEGPVLVSQIKGHPEYRNYLFTDMEPAAAAQRLGHS